MWNLPRSGIKPLSPALAGRFLTTKPPGKLVKLMPLNHWFSKYGCQANSISTTRELVRHALRLCPWSELKSWGGAQQVTLVQVRGRGCCFRCLTRTGSPPHTQYPRPLHPLSSRLHRPWGTSALERGGFNSAPQQLARPCPGLCTRTPGLDTWTPGLSHL